MPNPGEIRKAQSCKLCGFCDNANTFCFLKEKGMNTPFEERNKENFSPSSIIPCDYFLTFEELEGIIIEHILEDT